VEAEKLIAAIVADPDDQTAWMVYADWLLEHAHPRGELIQLEAAAAGGDNTAKWRIRQLEADEELFLSAPLLARSLQWRFVFERGFIRLAEYQPHAKQGIDAETIRALCSDPHAGLLRTIVVNIFTYGGEDPVRGETQRIYTRADVGDIDRELARLRWLRGLTLHGVAVSRLSHPDLRELDTDSITCRDAQIELPALESLDWYAMAERDAFGTMLSRPLPQLGSIALGRAYLSMISELAGHPIARQLESLTIHTNDLAMLSTLVTLGPAFPRLRELAVTGIHEDLEQADVDARRQALEHAFPAAKLFVPWSNLLPDPPYEEDSAGDGPEVDEQSRRPDGTIDAIGRWNRGR
jgi:uncharacterized protein (TIGR02996 family)